MKRANQPLAFRLKHKIVFLENMALSSLELERWEEKFKTFAEIIPVSENNFSTLEDLSFGHMISEKLFIFKIRYVSGININLKVVFKDRNFEIKRIINLREQDRLLQIIALEI